MVAPLYLVLIPVFLVIFLVGGAFYLRIVFDKECDLRTRLKSPLEEAQEMEREEAAREAVKPAGG